MSYFGAAAELQPWQEASGRENVLSGTTHDEELQKFYENAQKEALERKVSRKTSKRGSIWRKKSSAKHSASSSSSDPPPPPRAPAASLDSARPPLPGPTSGEADAELEQRDLATPLGMSRSIIPEALADLPAWYGADDPRAHYPLHNPTGPRRYLNHHLVPPSHKKPASRPSSIFSPSFPPMAPSAHSTDDLTRLPGPSRTPSNSPLPTPTSSQVRVADIGKPRSRKTSQTTPDGVDLLDVSDPWGTNWHHQSPYDIGLSSSNNNNPVGVSSAPATTDSQENGRSRHTSMTTRETRRRTVTPSPLSQSTSAVHLTPNAEGGVVTRKLSKRRSSAIGIFGGSAMNRVPRSAPATPFGDHDPNASISLNASDAALAVPKSGPPSSFKAPSVASKRSSVLGRIAKKFSILRRPSHDDRADTEQQTDATMVVLRSQSPEKLGQKRVPPPPVAQIVPPVPLPEPPAPATAPAPEPPVEMAHRLSIASIDQPLYMGKLTIANPDAPSESSTPLQRDIPLPPPPPPAEIVCSPQPPLMAKSPSSDSSTIHAPTIGTATPVPSSSMQVLSETMRPLAERPIEPPMPLPKSPPPAPPSTHSHRTSREASPTKAAAPSKRSSREGSPTKAVQSSSRTSRDGSPTKAPEPSKPSSSAPPQTNKRSSQTNGAPFPTAAPPPANGHSQEKRKSRSPEKKPVPPPKAEPAVSFPSSSPSSSNLVPAYLSSMISTYPYDVENTPLSGASMLVNPPTPYSPTDYPIPGSPAPTLPPKEHKRPPREPEPGMVSKQTETFKLVRSISGSVYASSETITAAGQQWEVVEEGKGKGKESSSSSKSKSRTKERESSSSKTKERERESSSSKTKERESGKERERRESSSRTKERDTGKERESGKDRERRESSSRTKERESSSSKKEHRREKEKETPEERQVRKQKERSSRRSVDIPSSTAADSRSQRRASSVEARQSRASVPEARPEKRPPSVSRKSAEVPVNVNKPQPAPPPPTPGPSTSTSRPLERNPSVSARPTSEVPTAADLNALRGREAWEMERLFKARSLYGSATATNFASGSAPAPAPPPPDAKPFHGSSHTSYTVQNGFQQSQPPSHIYHSMPTQSLPHPQNLAVQSPQSFMSSSDVLLPSRTNPLPEPPRDTPYKPGSSNVDGLLALDSDYWTQGAGITTAH